MDRFLLILCTAVYLACPHTRAQTARENRNAMQDSGIQSFFDAQAAKHPEKLYLHLNQPYYGVGDTIWFRAYLTDAVTHRPDTLSNFIYVDLYDRAKRLVTSRKIKRDSMGFANCLPLADTLFSGEYTLRAYTGWMLNFDASGFFQKIW